MNDDEKPNPAEVNLLKRLGIPETKEDMINKGKKGGKSPSEEENDEEKK